MRSIAGILILLFICYLISENKKAINYKELICGFVLQFVVAILLLKVSIIQEGLCSFTHVINGIKSATEEGTKFVFGYLGGGNSTPFDISAHNNLFIFAFQALPMIMVFSAISMLLFHWNVLPKIINITTKVVNKFSNIGGILSVIASSKIMLGQTEAPLLIKPYLNKISRSELFSVISCGLATTSGAAMLLYSALLDKVIPNVLSHIVILTVLSIITSILIARIVIPQVEKSSDGELITPYKFSGSIDAITRGTSDGLGMVLNIGAMVIVAIALISIVNQMLTCLPNINGAPITIQRILGIFFTPIAYIIGIPYEEVFKAGELLSLKVVVNEVVAFIELANSANQLSPKSMIIMLYAICNFANISSIGINISSYSVLVPERRDEIIGLCGKALIVGTLATCISGAVIGTILSF